MSFLDKYPRAKKFLETTGMTLDDALLYTKKLEGENRDESRNDIAL